MNMRSVRELLVVVGVLGMPPPSYGYRAKVNTTTVRVHDCKGSEIEITITKSGFVDTPRVEYRGMHVFVDSVRIYGCVMEPPKFILSKVHIVYNGREIRVPDSLLCDMGNPNLRTTHNRTIQVELSSDCHSLLVFMNNGDGAGVYSVLWVINLNTSNVTRHVEDMGDSFFYNIKQ